MAKCGVCGTRISLCEKCGKLFCPKCEDSTGYHSANIHCPDCGSRECYSPSKEAVDVKTKYGHAHF